MKKISLALASLSILALSACGIPQSPECAQYVECQAHYDEVTEAATPTDLSETYGAEGTCWTNAESAEACTNACPGAVDGLRGGLEAQELDVGPCAAE